MPDRPESIAPPAFTPPRHLDDLPALDISRHPLRESFLAYLVAEHRDDLIRPLDLLFGILLEGQPASHLYGGVPTIFEETAALGRDLRFCADYLREIARAMLDQIDYEEETVARWCAAFAPKVDALVAELEAFIGSAPRPPAAEEP
jgi:hypothetical protein